MLSEEAAVVAAFLARFLADRGRGAELKLAAYQALYPGFEQAIGREYAALQGASPAAVECGPAEPVHRIGRYALVRELGRGGQGEVHLAFDEVLRRNVALKVLRHVGVLNGEAQRRFQREGEIASRIDHAGICTVYETGSADGVHFIAMRYVEGETLASRIARSRSARQEGGASTRAITSRGAIHGALVLIEQAALAAHAAHEAGVVHRDLKPGNIMVTPEGAPVILDFGLARDLVSDLSSLTRSEELFGTPHYMSPEQITDSPTRLDRRTDVYSLGVCLYECLTLRRPFEAPTREALYQAILRDVPPDARASNPELPGDLRVVLQTALEKDLRRRYQTAADFAEDLRRVRELRPIRARRAGTALRVRRWVQRRPAQAALLVFVAALLTGAGYLAARWSDLTAGAAARTRQSVERLLEEGYLEHETHDLARARELFEAAFAQDPASVEALLGLVLCQLDRAPEEALARLLRHRSLVDRHPAMAGLRVTLLRRAGHEAEAAALAAQVGMPKDPLSLFVLAAQENRLGHRGDAQAHQRARALMEQCALRSPSARPLYHFELAHAIAHCGDAAARRAMADTLAVLFPESTSASAWRGQLLVGVDADAAAAAYTQALAGPSPGWQATIHSNLGGLELDRGNLSRAEQHLSRSLELHPHSASTWAKRMLLRRKSGDFAGVEATFREALRHMPDASLLHLHFGVALRGERRLPAALEHLERACALDARSAEARHELGVTLRRAQEPRRAKDAFRAALAIDPQHARTHRQLVSLLLELEPGEPGALHHAQEARRIEPSSESFAALAHALRAAGRLVESEAAGRDAIRLDESNASARFQLGQTLRARSDSAGAAAELEAAIRLREDFAEAWVHLGHLRLESKDRAGAIDAYRRAAGHQPDLAPAYVHLGGVLMESNDLPGAEAAFRTALPLQPHGPRIRLNLAAVLAGQWRDEEAIPLVQQAAQLAADDAGVQKLVARFAEQLHIPIGPDPAAATRPDASASRTLGNRATSAHRAGHPDRAVAIWRRCLAALPPEDHVSACEALTRAAHAALAAAARPGPPAAAPPAEAQALVDQARAWLAAALDRCEQLVAASPARRRWTATTLARLQQSAELQALRADAATLPEEEQAAWQQLWRRLDQGSAMAESRAGASRPGR